MKTAYVRKDLDKRGRMALTSMNLDLDRTIADAVYDCEDAVELYGWCGTRTEFTIRVRNEVHHFEVIDQDTGEVLKAISIERIDY